MQTSSYKILKLCVLGDLGVGKTSLATCFVTGSFDTNYRPTYQVCHFHKYLSTPDHNAYIQIWDTSGTDRFGSIHPYILRESDGALLVYDVTDIKSFSNIERHWLGWVKENMEQENGDGSKRLILVGNKTDKSSQRQVESRLARRFAQENSMLFYETSAVTKDSVDIAFLDGVNLLGDTLENSWEVSESLLTSSFEQQDAVFCRCM